MSPDALDELLVGFDAPVEPRPAFVADLRARLLAELTAPRRGSRPHLRRAAAVPGRRHVLLAAAIVLAAAVAAAAVLVVRALEGGRAAPTPDPAAAARAAEQAPVTIRVSGGPQGGNPNGGGGSFALDAAGGLEDDGPAAYSVTFPSATTTADGQDVAGVAMTVFLTGRRGGLELALTARAYGVSGDGAVSGQDAWLGSWRVVRGSGRYAGIHGGGTLAGIAGTGARVSLRLDGSIG